MSLFIKNPRDGVYSKLVLDSDEEHLGWERESFFKNSPEPVFSELLKMTLQMAQHFIKQKAVFLLIGVMPFLRAD